MINPYVQCFEEQQTGDNRKLHIEVSVGAQSESTTFYLRTRNSIRGFVCPLVRPSFCRSVRWSIMIESKSGKARISAPAHLPQRVAVYPALFDQVLEAAKTKEPKIFISIHM